MQTVQEWVASHCQHGSFEFDDQIRSYAGKKIVKEFDGTEIPFPQTARSYRHVHVWVLLEDGSSVGWNESPRSGWSFPRSSNNITQKFLFAMGLDEKGEKNV
jgi:hypothetical protein